MDSKRNRAMAYTVSPSQGEFVSARRRIGENALILTWVHRSLDERVVGYRNALERLVIDTPSAKAVEAERALTMLRQQIAAMRLG
jgi:hypothetical protein